MTASTMAEFAAALAAAIPRQNPDIHGVIVAIDPPVNGTPMVRVQAQGQTRRVLYPCRKAPVIGGGVWITRMAGGPNAPYYAVASDIQNGVAPLVVDADRT